MLGFAPFIFKLLSFLNALSNRCRIGKEWQKISFSFCIRENNPLKSHHVQLFFFLLNKQSLIKFLYDFYPTFDIICLKFNVL